MDPITTADELIAAVVHARASGAGERAEVVAAVRAGLLTLEEACERYSLSVEEFLSWQALIDKHGMRGLRTTKLKEYRRRKMADGGLGATSSPRV